MISPEVWNFEAPPSFTKYYIAHDEKKIWNAIRNQYFNHFVSITIPDAIHVHSSISKFFEDESQFYHAENVCAYELAKFDFIRLFVQKGKLTLISVGSYLDQDDCLVITPPGRLVLSLRRQTFQELGIEGKPSVYSVKLADKYFVTVDFCRNSFRPGGKSYERVLQRLSAKKDLRFNVVFAWDPHEPKICPSSIAAYFQHRGYKVKTCRAIVKERRDYNVKVPTFEGNDPEVLTEWIGAFNLGCYITESGNEFVTSYQIPQVYKKFGSVVHFAASGLFTTTRIESLVHAIMDYVSDLPDVAWLSMTVNGFEDAVVNWKNHEHFYYSTGDYHYTLVFRAIGSPLLCVHYSTSRRPKTTTKMKKRKNKKRPILET